MCQDGGQWRQWANYKKHDASVGYARKAVVDSTKDGGDSLYMPDVDARALERQAILLGVYVRTGRPNQVRKVLEFDSAIGASEGRESRWITVESTSGSWHGRPITEDNYKQRLKMRVKCCDER